MRDPDFALAAVDELNPELALLKARYRLEIARPYNISRATATRWIAKAREGHFETLFRNLQERL